MVDYQLAHWINDQKQKKFTDPQIKSYLLKYGYTGEVVNDATNFLQGHQKNQLKMGEPPFAGGMKLGTEHYDTMAIITLVALFFFPLISLPLGILSLIHIKHNPHLKGKALAIIGVVIGGIIFLILLGYLLLILSIFRVPSRFG